MSNRYQYFSSLKSLNKIKHFRLKPSAEVTSEALCLTNKGKKTMIKNFYFDLKIVLNGIYLSLLFPVFSMNRLLNGEKSWVFCDYF